jgi:choline dehydrogenase
LKRKNLVVLTKANVQKLLITDGQVTGISFVHNSSFKSVQASSEVILSAGAIGSPKILQLSGIGPGKILSNLNIPVIVDRPAVGGNLQDHYQMRTIVELIKRDSMNDHVRNPFTVMSMGLKWVLAGTGPLTVGAGNVGGGVRTKLSVNGQPDIQFNVMPLSTDRPGQPLHKYSGFTAAAWQCHPESRGRSDIISSDPSKDTRIQPNYLSESIDQQTLVEGIKILREIYQQPSFKNLWDKEMIPGSNYQTDEQILDAAKNMGGTVYHYAGTCRMGIDNAAVVDHRLRVRGVKNLRVVDASIMPEITSANINAPTLMIAEKAADIILNKS